MTDYEKLKEVFDEIGVDYEENNYILTNDISLYSYDNNSIFEFDSNGKFKNHVIIKYQY